MRVRSAALAALLLAPVAAPTAAQHASDVVFDRATLARIDVTLPPDSLDKVLANPLSDHEVPATFVYTRAGQTETVERVGFRLRGNTSRNARKKSFKLSMNTFVRGRAWRGLEKLNLNGEHNDPSIQRTVLGWSIFADAGLMAPRAAHVQLYVNGAFFGVYANVEQMDETFLARRYGTDDGTLFKCLYPADLAYRGSTGASYTHRDGAGRIVYEWEQGADSVASYDQLAAFVTLLNQTPSASFASTIEQAFDVNGFLKSLALDVVSGSWDNYWYNKNNYYLYFAPETGRAHYLPYDYDNTFGIDFVGRDWANRNPYTWGSSAEARPLASRILAVPDFRARYTFYLRQLLDGPAAEARLTPRIDSLRVLIDAAAERDTFRTLDYGYTVTDFRLSTEQAAGAHVKYGIKPFLAARRASLRSALDGGNVAPIVHLPTFAPARATTSDSLTVSVKVEDEAAPTFVGVLDGATNMAPLPMFDDGTHGDARARDGVYTRRLAPSAAAGTRTVRATATDVTGQTRTSPEARLAVVDAATGLVVNEIVASNDGTFRDPAGDADDWIELYNPTSQPVRLLGYTLTDNFAAPAKWAFPDTTLAPGAYLVVWADEEAAEGPLHASFKLSAGGEAVGLFVNGQQVDAVTFPALAAGQSYGRSPSGSGAWQVLTALTPGAANPLASGVEDVRAGADELALHPNPFADRFTVALPVRATAWTVEVYDVLGRVQVRRSLATGATAWTLDVPLAPGVYVVRATSGRESHVLRAVRR